MKTRSSLMHACLVGSAFVVLPALVISACSPDEKVNPAPVGTSSSSSSSSSGTAGEGGAGGSGAGGSQSTSSSSGGGMAGSGGTGGQGGSSNSSSGGQTGGAGGSGGLGGGGAGGMATMDAGPSDASVCPSTTMAVPIIPAPHVAMCSPVTYLSNPPTSGPHYPIWAAFKWYTAPVPRGFTVHSQEHGAVVISYNCPNGCTDELGQIAAFLDARPADPLCVAPLRARIIVTPDPLLDTKFAASAWGGFYTADCLDLTSLGAFIDANYAKAPENFCNDGVDVLAPNSGVPADCGMATDGGTDAASD